MSPELPLILLADDSLEDCKVVQMALKQIGSPCSLKTVADGYALLQALRGQGRSTEHRERPALILLDLNLPFKTGLETLQEIKADPLLKALPVVIWSTSESPGDVQSAYQLGANSYFSKPDSFDKVVSVMRALTHYWLREVRLPPLS